MNLKEQLRQNLTGHLSDEKTEIVAKIAEDFAISFAEWFINSWCLHSLSYGDITIKQSLEIFKKES